MEKPSGNEWFFNMHNFEAQKVCHLSENQNFYMRQHFDTYSVEVWLLVYVRTCGTKKF